MQYLTVHDLIWLNSQVNRKAVPYRFMDLEGAIGYQYSYQQQTDPLHRIGRFLEAMLTMKPFDEGNEKTALVATVCLLRANGYETKDAAGDWLPRVARGEASGVEAIRAIAQGSTTISSPRQLKDDFKQVLARFA